MAPEHKVLEEDGEESKKKGQAHRRNHHSLSLFS